MMMVLTGESARWWWWWNWVGIYNEEYFVLLTLISFSCWKLQESIGMGTRTKDDSRSRESGNGWQDTPGLAKSKRTPPAPSIMCTSTLPWGYYFMTPQPQHYATTCWPQWHTQNIILAPPLTLTLSQGRRRQRRQWIMKVLWTRGGELKSGNVLGGRKMKTAWVGWKVKILGANEQVVRMLLAKNSDRREFFCLLSTNKTGMTNTPLFGNVGWYRAI